MMNNFFSIIFNDLISSVAVGFPRIYITTEVRNPWIGKFAYRSENFHFNKYLLGIIDC